MKCALCCDIVNIEDPTMNGGLVAVNPETHRLARMHDWCYKNALDSLRGVPCDDVNYIDKYDEYMTKYNV